MYENMTFSYLLQRMLDRVQGNVDKREGSIIYDALAPRLQSFLSFMLSWTSILI